MGVQYHHSETIKKLDTSIKKEGEEYVARCPEMGIVIRAGSREAAQKELQRAIESRVKENMSAMSDRRDPQPGGGILSRLLGKLGISIKFER